MFVDSISLIALIAVQLGFAGLLGAKARQAKTIARVVLICLGALIFAVSILRLPLPTSPRIILWIASAVLFVYFFKPDILSGMQVKLAWFYAGGAMLLILAWSATQSWLAPVFSLGLAAGLAGMLAWRRGLRAAD